MKQMLYQCVGVIALCLEGLQGQEIVVNTREGEVFLLQVAPDTCLQEVQERIEALTGTSQKEMIVEIEKESHLPQVRVCAARTQGGFLGYPRDYFAEVLLTEKMDIRFIITTLANKNIIGIALETGPLEEAGDRIDHIHPLRFLSIIFQDEELKVGIRNIRGKGWIWSQFIRGLKECLATEMSIDNISLTYIEDFCQTVGINIGFILPSIAQRDWDMLVDQLITHIPRVGDHDRYDMSCQSRRRL
jgi:hypothetical protein